MTRILQETALDNSEAVLISTFREAGESNPDCLPAKWDELTDAAKSVCLWYAHNILSYRDKALLANHIVGCELIANEQSGVKPVMTAARAQAVRAMVFSTFPKE